MGIGGTEQVIRQLITNMAKSNITSEIVCIDGTIGAIGLGLQKNDITIHEIARKAGFDKSLIMRLRKLIRSGHFDVVHCHQYTPFIYGFFASFGLGNRVIFTEHGRFYPDRYRYKAFIINLVASFCSHSVVAISQATKDALSKYEFIPRSKIQVIYNGIQKIECADKDLTGLRDSLGIKGNDYVVGTISRLDPVKNQKMMIKSFKRFLEAYPDSWLVIVGDGPEMSSLKKLCLEISVENRTIFTGFIDDPSNYLGIMDVFLLPSFTEGTSMTLLESMCLGIPAIATKVGGNPEIILDGETGFLTASNDESALADAMTRLRSNQVLAQQFSENAKKRFNENFAAGIMAKKYMELYVSN